MRQTVLANTAALIGGLLLLSPAVTALSAQTAPTTSACSVDQNKPKELALAWLTFTRAQSAAAGPARDALLKQLMKDLVDKPEKFASNPGGYNYVLAQVYSLLVQQPGGMMPTTRGAVGLTTRPTEPFDAVVELDKSYNAWGAASPTCAADINQSRGSDAWFAIIKRADDALNANQYDSAQFYVNRSMILEKDNPYPHHILASLAQQKNDQNAALSEWKQVVQLSGSDTTYRDIKLRSQYYLGVSSLQDALKKTGDAQKAQAKVAAGYLKEFLDANSTSADAPNVMSNLSQAIQMSGDTAQLKGMYGDMVKNPSKYNEAILTMAGVVATQAGDAPSALKLFEATVQKNPNARDGLRNLAATHYTLSQYDQMFPPLRSLVKLDPNNYDAVMMFAYASQGIGKNAKDPAVKKAWTDSLIKYQSQADSLKAKVEVTGFTRNAQSTDVTLSVEQAAMGSGSYNLSMDFLGADGAVVSSDTKAVGPLAKGEKKTVTLSGKGTGIVAFRYKPLG